MRWISTEIAHRIFTGLFILVSLFISITACAKHTAVQNSAPLALPGSMPLVDYEKKLYRWIIERQYSKLDWAMDKGVRDTGAYLNGQYYGTHPAVRIFYSPGVMQWLQSGRPADKAIPDGAMIVKEMFTPPAAIYRELANDPRYRDPAEYEKLIASLVNGWTVMVKDSHSSSDGWFWASVSRPTAKQTIEQSIALQVDTLENRGDELLRYSGFGMPCIRCHASAKTEMTFSDLDNILGQAGSPLIFKVDDSWRTPAYIAGQYPLCTLKADPFVVSNFYFPAKNKEGVITQPGADTLLACPPEKKPSASVSSDHDNRDNMAATATPMGEPALNREFLQFFPQFADMNKSDVAAFPPAWQDHVVMPAGHPTEYVTSDNCVGCHGGLAGTPNRNVMFIPDPNGKVADGFAISEYGEWRWSPMGVAGRDPIFHAQLESEMAYLARDNRLTPSPLKAPLEVSKRATTNLCLSCHGAMGQRQLAADAKTDKSLDSNFKVDYFYLDAPVSEDIVRKQQQEGTHGYAKYGALAREGISCMVCHRIDAADEVKVRDWSPAEPDWLAGNMTPAQKELAYNLFHHSTGAYNPGPADRVFGPFEVIEKPMRNALNLTPMHNAYTSDSQMCGNCHTINLPNIGSSTGDDKLPVLRAASSTSETTAPFSDYAHSIEQSTFLEWQNSSFGEVDAEGKKGKNFRSCQDCHMPRGFKSGPDTTKPDNGKTENINIKIDQVVTQIASIQDSSYPQAGHSLSNEEIHVPLRDNYRRHTHVGLNVFLESMIDQFSDILGLNKSDYMTGAETGVQLALDSMIQQAREETAQIKISSISLKPVQADAYSDCKDAEGESVLKATITVNNNTGHRMPSGVAFRRVFIEFSVLDGDSPVWQSGATNSVGLILDGQGKPLQTEFFDNNSYQQHHQTINCQDQVQIYEELTRNALNEFTTSFIHRVNHVKDNRLLPDGWRQSDYFIAQGQVMKQFMEATDPAGLARSDPDYANAGNSIDFVGRDRLDYEVRLPPGTDTSNLSVQATLYSQAIPPYWLKQRFDAVKVVKDPNNTRATRRLYYMASHLNLDGTQMNDWKLRIASDEQNVK